MVGCQRLRDQDVLKRRALAADLQFRVALGALEGLVQIDLPTILSRILEGDLLGQDQHPAGPQPMPDLLQQGRASLRGDKLQDKIHGHHRGVPDLGFSNIGAGQFDGRAGSLADGLPAAFKHGR